MREHTARAAVQAALLAALRVRARPLGPAALRRPALVIAPHPDDETLGCGGTIARARAAGAEVRIAFMTDGEGSHAGLPGAGDLRTRRRCEAVAACRELGVAEQQLAFLGYPDGHLADAEAEATAAVCRLLAATPMAAVYAPYRHDRHPDHEAAYRIAATALHRSSGTAVLYEYPVWAWQHWPWVGLGRPVRLQRRRVVAAQGSGWRASLHARFGLRLLTECGEACDIRGVREHKRRALARYESQLVRPDSAGEWPTLGDVDGGDFLACFFRDCEPFRRTVPHAEAAR